MTSKQEALQRTVKISRMKQHELVSMVLRLEDENRSLKERLRVLEENCLFYPDEIVRRACGVSNV